MRAKLRVIDMKRAATSAFIGFALATASAAGAQNLAGNGKFATDLSGWSNPDAVPVWSSFDIDGSPTSGSAYYANTQPNAGTQPVVLEQCVAIAQKGAYIFGVSGYAPGGQTASGNLVGGYAVDVAHADCSGGYSALGGFFFTHMGQWESHSTSTTQNPVLIVSLNPAASILIELRVYKADASGSFGGYFDDAYVIRDTLFQSGFE